MREFGTSKGAGITKKGIDFIIFRSSRVPGDPRKLQGSCGPPGGGGGGGGGGPDCRGGAAGGDRGDLGVLRIQVLLELREAERSSRSLANFQRSVLDCINTDICDKNLHQILIFQCFSISDSTRFTFFCTARDFESEKAQFFIEISRIFREF